MRGRVTLLIGGARAGKSTMAQRLAATAGECVLFVATATAGDDEMVERIARHRAERPAGWTTIEEPLVPHETLGEGGYDAIIVDCITLWTSNRLLAAGAGGAGPDLVAALLADADRLVERARARSKMIVLVTNEVGLGIVPEYPLGRLFRDALGAVNARLAELADQVELVVAGLPLTLKAIDRSDDGD